MPALKPAFVAQGKLSDWAGFPAWALQMKAAQSDPVLQQTLLDDVPEGYTLSHTEVNQIRDALNDHADLIDAIAVGDIAGKENTGVAQTLVDALESAIRADAPEAVTLETVDTTLATHATGISTAQATANAAATTASSALASATANEVKTVKITLTQTIIDNGYTLPSVVADIDTTTLIAGGVIQEPTTDYTVTNLLLEFSAGLKAKLYPDYIVRFEWR